MAKPKESPIFVKTHDFVCWLLERTIRFPKSQRFVMARRVEESALDFQESLIRASRERGRRRQEELREADVRFEILRRHVRTCVDLRLLTWKQYEFAAERIREIGRILGGWMRSVGAVAGGGPGRGAGSRAAGAYRVIRGGSWNNNDDNLRCANRNNNNPSNTNNNLGFRCARNHEQRRMPEAHGLPDRAGS